MVGDTGDVETSSFAAYQATRDPRLRDRFVERHLGLAVSLAERYVHRGIPRDDLRQVAVVGLIKAIDRFDPNRGHTFAAFAVPTILGELRRHFRDAGWMVSVPRRLQELRQQADRAVAMLEQRQGRHPRLDEVADELGVDPESVMLALDGLRSCYRPADVDRVPSGALQCTVTDPIDDLSLQDLVATLPARERRIVFLRFWVGLTQQEIADRIGCSQMHVSRLLRRSLEELGQRLDEDVWDDACAGTLST